jgi:hypothetical protein
MMDTIDFLERVGSDAELRHGNETSLELAMSGTQVAPGLRAALLARDCGAVYRMLDQGPLMSAQVPAEEEEGEVPADEDGAEERLPGTLS